MNNHREYQPSHDQITIIRDGEEKITSMDALFDEKPSMKLIECIIANNRMKDYAAVYVIRKIDIFYRIWDIFRAGNMEYDECAWLFSTFRSCDMPRTRFFRRACREWNPSDSRAFDILPPRFVGSRVVNDGLGYALVVAKGRSHDKKSMEHYLDLCFFLVERKYVVDAELLRHIFSLCNKVPGIVGMIRDRLAITPKNFRTHMRYYLDYRLGNVNGIISDSQRPINYYHLLTELVEPSSQAQLRQQLIDSYEKIGKEIKRCKGQRKYVHVEPRFRDHIEWFLNLVCIPESSLTFPQRFQLSSPWKRESVETTTILLIHRTQGNVLHLLPPELIFVILEWLF